MSKPDWSAATGSLDLDTLTEAYAAGTLTPTPFLSDHGRGQAKEARCDACLLA